MSIRSLSKLQGRPEVAQLALQDLWSLGCGKTNVPNTPEEVKQFHSKLLNIEKTVIAPNYTSLEDVEFQKITYFQFL